MIRPLRPRNRVPEVNAGHVVVFGEKDNDVYYSGAKGFLPIARKVFDERDKSDWWSYPKSAPKPPTEPPATPPGLDPELQSIADARRRTYEEHLRVYRVIAAEWDLLERARNGDDEAAALFLVGRQDHEYEGFTVWNLITP